MCLLIRLPNAFRQYMKTVLFMPFYPSSPPSSFRAQDYVFNVRKCTSYLVILRISFLGLEKSFRKWIIISTPIYLFLWGFNKSRHYYSFKPQWKLFTFCPHTLMQRPSEVTVNTTISFYDPSLKGTIKWRNLICIIFFQWYTLQLIPDFNFMMLVLEKMKWSQFFNWCCVCEFQNVIFYRYDKKGEREASNKMEISFVPQKLLIILKGTFHSRKMDMKAWIKPPTCNSSSS